MVYPSSVSSPLKHCNVKLADSTIALTSANEPLLSQPFPWLPEEERQKAILAEEARQEALLSSVSLVLHGPSSVEVSQSLLAQDGSSSSRHPSNDSSSLLSPAGGISPKSRSGLESGSKKSRSQCSKVPCREDGSYDDPCVVNEEDSGSEKSNNEPNPSLQVPQTKDEVIDIDSVQKSLDATCKLLEANFSHFLERVASF